MESARSLLISNNASAQCLSKLAQALSLAQRIESENNGPLLLFLERPLHSKPYNMAKLLGLGLKELIRFVHLCGNAVGHPRCWLTHCTSRGTLHNTRSIKDRWFRQRRPRPSHPSGSVLHGWRCAEANIPPERTCWAYAPMRGVSACRASLSTPTCDP